MLRLSLVVVLLAILVGCSNETTPTDPSSSFTMVPMELIPSGPDAPDWEIDAFVDYVASHPMRLATQEQIDEYVDFLKYKAGDDDAPGVACDAIGPPLCKKAYRETYYCTDVCGSAFWSLSEAGVCIDAAYGIAYSCNGYGGASQPMKAGDDDAPSRP